jgi:hypothetical protein
MSSELAPTDATAKDEADATLAKETEAGKRLRSVTIENGALVLSGNDEAQRRVGEAFGSDSREFQTQCLSQLISILPEKSNDGEDYTLALNSAVEMLHAINPRDALEGMLAVQMVACHHLSLVTMRRTKGASMLPQFQANGNLATKFSRTFIAQLEALDRHRRGGKQIVEHVHVNAGGQAVIAGTVNAGGGGNEQPKSCT